MGCLVLPACDLDKVGIAIAGRELNDAEPVAQRPKAERLGIDGNGVLECYGSGQVALVEINRHMRRRSLQINKKSYADFSIRLEDSVNPHLHDVGDGWRGLIRTDRNDGKRNGCKPR